MDQKPPQSSPAPPQTGAMGALRADCKRAIIAASLAGFSAALLDLHFLITQVAGSVERWSDAFAAFAVALALSTSLAVLVSLLCILAMRLVMFVQPGVPLLARFKSPVEFRLPFVSALITLFGFSATVVVVIQLLAPIPSLIRRLIYLTLAIFALACVWFLASKYIHRIALKAGGLLRLAMFFLILVLVVTWWTLGVVMIRFAIAADVMLVVSLGAYYRPLWRIWHIRSGVVLVSAAAVISLPWSLREGAVELVYLSKSLPSYALRLLPAHNRGTSMRHVRAAIADRVSHPVTQADPQVLQFSEPPSPRSTLPNILLVTLDALRADRIGARAGGESLTPNLDRMARSALVFRHAYAAAPETIGSMSQLMTGLFWHEIPHLPAPLGAVAQITPGTPTLASKLGAHGYSTIAVLQGDMLPFYPSLALGFSNVINWDHKKAQVLDTAALFDSTIELLNTEGREPLFIWMHCFETHGHANANRVDVAGYDLSVTRTDRQIERLLTTIAGNPQSRDTLLIVTADHGEGLGEGGVNWHGTGRAPVLAIPLIVQMPGVAPKEVSTSVGTHDIYATILARAGFPNASGHGRDLAMIANESVDESRIVYHSMVVYTTPVQVYEVGATSYPWQFMYQVRADFRMLRRLDRDPFGSVNLAGRDIPAERDLLNATLSTLRP